MRARFHPEARLDFKNAAAHYAAVRPDLGQGFYRHIESLIAEIEADPTLFRVYRPPQARRHFRRRSLTRSFTSSGPARFLSSP
jgi:hypothetical protein